MAVYCPPAGLPMISAGVSGAINGASQCLRVFKHEEEFKDGSFLGAVVVNGTIAVVTGGIGAFFQAAKVSVQIGVGIAANTAGAAVATFATNGIEGRPLNEGVGVSVIAGALTGGLGAGSG